jgi:hypothetical protein
MIKNMLYRPHLDKGRYKEEVKFYVNTIDLVLIDPQSVGKRTHDLMDDHLLACQ